MISPETKELILAQTDIVELINSYVPLKRSGSQFRANCPFHNEKTPSFYVTPSMQRYKCFGCQAGGDAIKFLMDFKNMPFPDALRELAQAAGVTIVEETSDPQAEKHRKQRSRLLEVQNKAARHMHQLLLTSPDAKHARAYLRGRGYGKEMAERWVVGWVPADQRQFLAWAKEQKITGRELCDTGMASPRDDGNPRAGLYMRFRDRLMFPIHNDYGDIIAFSGRQLVEDKNTGKYINSPETALFKKSKVFFGLDRARRPIGKEKFALMCEGQIDVIACHEAGFENAIATLGTAATADHARMLKRYTETVILCFDSDAAGHKAVSKAFGELSPLGLEVRVAPLPEGQDPDSLIKSEGADAFRTLLAKASGFFDYQIDFAHLHSDLSQPMKRAALANELARYLKLIPDSVAADSLLAHCATRLGIGIPEFRDAISKVREQKSYQSREEKEERIQPTPFDSSILLLCQLALQSAETQQWLSEQTESLLETIVGLPGSGTLARILSQLPTAGAPASINRFLGELATGDALTLSAALENPLPDSPIAHATRALTFLSRKTLRKRSDEIASLLNSKTLPSEDIARLLTEARQIALLLHDSNNP